jgi:CHAT domain-containing protein
MTYLPAVAAQGMLQDASSIRLTIKQMVANGQFAAAAMRGEKWLAENLVKRYVNPIDVADLAELVGEAYVRDGQYGVAIPSLELALRVSENEIGPQDIKTASRLNVLANTYGLVNQYEKAIPLQIRALTIREKSLGESHPDTLTSMDNLAALFSANRKFDLALPLQQRASAIRERVLGPNHPDTADSLSTLAMTNSELALYEQAQSLNKRAFAIREKVLGSEHPDTVTSLNNLAMTYFELSQYDQALLLQERALAIRERISGPISPSTATSLNNLAHTHCALAHYDKCIPLQERALAIWEDVFGPGHPTTARGLANLGATFRSVGEYEKALQHQLRATAIYEKQLGSDHVDTAISIDNLAATFNNLARYESALPLQRRALAIREKALGSNHPDTALSLGNLANTYNLLGQYEKALPLQQRVVSVRESSLGLDHPDTALALSNQANTYNNLRQYDAALPLDQRALEIRERVLGPMHPATAQSLGNLANLYGRLAQHDKALPMEQRALLICESAFGPSHPDTALRLSNLGTRYVALGQYQNALPLQQRALAIRLQALGKELPEVANSNSNMSRTLYGMGDASAAIVALKTAVNIYQAVRDQAHSIGNTEFQNYTASVAIHFEVLAKLLVEEGRWSEAQQVLDMLKEEEQFSFVRGGSNPDIRRTRAGLTFTEQKWALRYSQIADRLAAIGAEERELARQAKLGLSSAQKARQTTLQADLRVAQAAFNNYMVEMRHDFSRKSDVRRAELAETSEKANSELQELIQGLGDDVALLRYYVTDEQVGVLLTTASKVQVARSTKINSAELRRMAFAYRAALGDPKTDPLPMAQALYKVLLQPVENDLVQAGAKTVMLSLDGELRYLPFGALHDGRQYAAQRWKLPVYTSVVREKLRDPTVTNWQAAGLGVTKSVGGFKALPAVRAEMSSVVKTADNSGVVPGEIYLDETFSAKRLKDVGQRRFELVHIASHFQLSPGTELNSFLLLGDGQQLTLGDIRTENYRFDNVDLLTLSACNTGLGGRRDGRGLEVEGLGVIAQQQGAKAVLATLWAVDDKSTSTLMADLYLRRQAQGLSKIEALRQSQVALMQQPKYAHPFYWAPFILMGNWK